jgi:mycothiol synthase
MLALPDGYAVRAPGIGDLDSVLTLMIAGDIAEYGVPDSDPDDVLGAWRRHGFDLSSDAWLVLGPDGEAAGYAEAFDCGRRVECLAVVHPEHLGRGIGAFLAGRMEARTIDRLSTERPAAVIRNTVASVDRRGQELLVSSGFTVERRQIRLRADAVRGVALAHDGRRSLRPDPLVGRRGGWPGGGLHLRHPLSRHRMDPPVGRGPLSP